jgi:hypothetical protein
MTWGAVALLAAAGCGTEGDGEAGAEAESVTSALSTPWSNLSLVSPWANRNGNVNPPATRTINGITVFRGLLTTGLGYPNPPFTVSSGYPANFSEMIAALSDGTVGDFVFAPGPDPQFPQIEQPGYNGQPGPQADVWTSLDGVSFDPSAKAAKGSTLVTLQPRGNWTATLGYLGMPMARSLNGIVYFQGGCSRDTGTGTSAYLFTLPAGFHPAADVYIPVSVGGGNKGRLLVAKNGDVSAWTEGYGTTSFVALTGAWFALSTSGATVVTTPKNSWVAQPYSTGQVAYRNDNGVIRFQGGVWHGTGTTIFTLPLGMRPATLVHLAADGVNGVKAEIDVGPGGNVFVTVPDLTTAAAFLSLDGVSFAL